MAIPIIEEKQIIENIKSKQYSYLKDYFAFYSSWMGGIIKNPSFMLSPIDDHLFHRGDGVFEGVKAVNGSIYLLDEHLDRLFFSAEKISLQSSFSKQQIKEIVFETFYASNQSEALIRIFLSRGPGSFSVNPYDTIGSQLYVVVHHLQQPSKEKYENGVAIGSSKINIKPSWLATVKSCNYLANVLVKKEAVDRKLDFIIGTDEENYITESATENIILLDQENILIHPNLDHVLKGITMTKIFDLAEKSGFKTNERPISIDHLLTAKEIMITGTSINVLPVVSFENKKIGNGKPGPIAKKLNELILQDIQQNTAG